VSSRALAHRRARTIVAVLCTTTSLLGTSLATWPGLAAATPVQQSGGGCSNELRREEQNTLYLPECRAYEMVSPLEKNGTDVTGNGDITEAADNGEAVAYGALAGFSETSGSGALGFTQYIARREAGNGWHTQGITPRATLEAFQFLPGAVAATDFSSDLGYAAIEGYQLEDASGGVPKEINLYRENIATGGLETISEPLTAGPFSPLGMNGTQRGSSADLSTVTFETSLNLVPEATGFQRKLYMWRNGQLQLAGILPDGSVPSGGSEAPAGQGEIQDALLNRDAVSTDGSRVAFASPTGGSPQLYLRRNGTSTAWVSQSEASSPIAEPEGVRYQAMTPDGHEVVFTSGDSLLDADPGGAGVGLYIYTDGQSPESESNLTFVARLNASSGEQLVSAISNDAKRIYFYTNAGGEFAKAGTYIWDEGAVHLVAETQTPLSRQAPYAHASLLAQASANGDVFAFVSHESLTGEAAGAGGAQLYVYDESTLKLRCVSCMPAGTPTTASVEVEPEATKEPQGIDLPVRPRFVSSDGGHVFFATAAPLAARDTNGLTDVYEYDSASGEVSLLSPGTGGYGAWFGASDESGDNVFILTRGQLAGGDTDSLVDLYDVRVGGGFAQPSPQTGGCVGDECQGTPSAAPSFSVASGFTGLGNVAGKEGETVDHSKPRALTRAQRLAGALKKCRRRPKRARARCIAQARGRYGPHTAKKARKAPKSMSNRVGRKGGK
jgi:Tol biopolymer transport system component